MSISNFLHLVHRNIRMRRIRMLSARLGIGLAVFFLALGLGASLGIWRGLQPALEKLFPERKLIVRPPAVDVAMLRVQTLKITGATLKQFRDLEGVARVDPQMPVKFPVHAEGTIGPLQDSLATEIVIHGVPRSLVAESLPEDESFEWTFKDTRPCPVVVSSYFLDLYNLGLSESIHLPKLNEGALLGRTFELVLGESVVVMGAGTGKTRRVECAVAGFTRDPNLTGVAAPLSAVRAFNEWYYGDEYQPVFTIVQIETQSVADLERVQSSIESMGYLVSVPGEAFERWRWAMRGGFALVLALGLGVLLIALGNVANTFALVMTERREEIGLLQALGATKRTVRRLYLAEVAWIGVTASVVGGILAALLAWIASEFLERWTAGLATVETLSVVPRPLVLAAIILAVLALSLGVTWPVVTRATHRPPAQLLRE